MSTPDLAAGDVSADDRTRPNRAGDHGTAAKIEDADRAARDVADGPEKSLNRAARNIPGLDTTGD
jgi:hypothetical protein